MKSSKWWEINKPIQQLWGPSSSPVSFPYHWPTDNHYSASPTSASCHRQAFQTYESKTNYQSIKKSVTCHFVIWSQHRGCCNTRQSSSIFSPNPLGFHLLSSHMLGGGSTHHSPQAQEGRRRGWRWILWWWSRCGWLVIDPVDHDPWASSGSQRTTNQQREMNESDYVHTVAHRCFFSSYSSALYGDWLWPTRQTR